MGDKKIQLRVGFVPDFSDVDNKIKNLKYEIDLTANTKELEKIVSNIQKELNQLDLDIDTKKVIDSINKALKDSPNLSVDVELNKEATKKVAEQLSMLDKKHTITLDVEATKAKEKVKEVKSELDGVSKKETVKINIDIDDAVVKSKINKLQEQYKDFPVQELIVNTGKAQEDIQKLIQVSDDIKLHFDLNATNELGEEFTRLSKITGAVKDEFGQIQNYVVSLSGNTHSFTQSLESSAEKVKKFSESWVKAKNDAQQLVYSIYELNRQADEGGTGADLGLSRKLEKLKKDINSIDNDFKKLSRKNVSESERAKSYDELSAKLKKASDEYKKTLTVFNKKSPLNDNLKAEVANLSAVSDKLNAIKKIADVGLLKNVGLDGNVDKQTAELDRLSKELTDIDLFAPKAKEKIQALGTEISNLGRDVNKTSNELEKQTTGLEGSLRTMKNLGLNMATYMEKHKKSLSPELIEHVSALLEKSKEELNTKKEILDVTNKIKNAQYSMKAEVGDAPAPGFTENVIDRFKSFAPLSLSMSLTYRAFNAVTKAMGEMINVAKETDKALVELRKVTSGTDATYRNFTQTAFALGKELGRSGVEVINATADFARMGYGLEYAMGLAEQSLLMMNVGDGINSLEDATKSIIATLKAYNIESENTIEYAKYINDVYNEVSNNFAIDTAQLADGIRRSATVLKSAGNTFEETVGMLTGANEIIQNIEKTSSGINVIVQRINSIKMDKKTGELAASLQEAFDLAGVQLLDFNGELRSTYDILADLSGSWDTLDSKTKAYLGEEISGKRQRVVLESLMSGWGQVEDATRTAMESQGSAMIENLKYLDSVEGRLQQLKATLGSITNSIHLKEFLKIVIEMTNGIADFVDILFTVGKVDLKNTAKELSELELSYDKFLTGQRFADKFRELATKSYRNPEEQNELKNTISDLIDLYPSLNGIVHDTSLTLEEQSKAVDRTISEYGNLAKVQKESFEDRGVSRLKELNEEWANAQKEINKYSDELRELQLMNPDVGTFEHNQIQANLYSIEQYRKRQTNYEEEMRLYTSSSLTNMFNETDVLMSKFDLVGEKTKALSGDFDALKTIASEALGGDIEVASAFYEILEALELTEEQMSELTETFPNLMKEFGDTSSIKDLSTELQKLSGTFNTLQGALDEYNKEGYISRDTYLNLLDKHPDYAKYFIIDFDGRIKPTKDYARAMMELDRQLDEQVANAMERSRAEAEALDSVSQSIDGVTESRRNAKQAGDADLTIEPTVEVPEIQKTITTDLNNLRKEFKDGKISADEYFKSLNNGFRKLQVGTKIKDLKPSGLDLGVKDAIDNFKELTILHNKGEISSALYAESIKDLNGILISTDAILNDLEMTQNGWVDSEGNVREYNNALRDANESIETYLELQENFNKHSNLISKHSTNGIFDVRQTQMHTTEMTVFKNDFIKTLERVRRTNKDEWNSIVGEISQATGKTKKETEDGLLDITSSFYNTNTEFNKTINSISKKTETNIKNLGVALSKVLRDISKELKGLDISTNVFTNRNSDGSYTVRVGASNRTNEIVEELSRQSIGDALSGVINKPSVSGTGASNSMSQREYDLRREGRLVEIDHNNKLKAEKKRLEEEKKIIEELEKLSNEALGVGSYLGDDVTSKYKSDEIKYADRYAKYNALLAHNNSLLEKNKILTGDTTRNSLQKAEALQKEVAIQRRHQEILHMTNQARRNERIELEKLLSEHGFKFSGEGDNRMITNLDNINGKVKEVEDAMNRYMALTSEVAKGSADWWEIERAIKGVADAIETVVSQIDLYLTSFSVDKSNLDMQMKFVDLALDRAKKLNDLNDVGDFTAINNLETQKLQLWADMTTLALEENMALEEKMIAHTKKSEELRDVLYKFGASFNGDVISNMGALKGRSDYKALIEPFVEEFNELALKILPSIRTEINENIYATAEWKQRTEELVEASRKAAQEKEMNRLNKQLQEYKDNLSALADLQEKVVAIIRKRGEEERKILDKNHKQELDQFKERHDIRIKGYKDELDEFNKMIKAKIEALDKQYAEDDFAEQLRKEEEKANEIKRDIAIKSLDDSLTARTQVIQLEKDLASQSEKIADLKEKRERTLRKDNLNAQLKDKETNTNSKIDLETKYYNDALKQMQERQQAEKESLDERYNNYNVYIEARQALESGYVLSFDGNMKSIKDAYVDFENRFGQGMGILGERIQFDFINNLQKAQQAMVDLATVGIEQMARMAYTLDEVQPVNWDDPTKGVTMREPTGRTPSSSNPFNMSDSDWRKYLANKQAYEDMAKTGRLDHAQLNVWNGENIALRKKYGIEQDNHTYAQLKAMEANMNRDYTPSTTIDPWSPTPKYQGVYSPITSIGATTMPDKGRDLYNYTADPYLGQDPYSQYFGNSTSGGGSGNVSGFVQAMLAQQGYKYSTANRKKEGYADCSSSVWRALVNSGLVPEDANWSGTKSMLNDLTRHDFVDLGKEKFENLKYGDILLKPGSHVEVYVGNGKTFGAQQTNDGNPNDDIVRYRNVPYTGYTNVLRLKGYQGGGKVDYTGLAMVHGSPTEPEWVFNNEQFHALAKLMVAYDNKPVGVNTDIMRGKSVTIGLSIQNLVNIEGNATRETIPQIQKAGQNVLDVLTAQLKKNGTTIDFKG